MSLISALARLSLAAGLLPFALDWRSPMLVGYRAWALGGLIVVPICLIAAGFRATFARRPSHPMVRLLSGVALAFAAIAAASTLTIDVRFWWMRHQVLFADPIELRALGRHVVVGFRDPAELQAILSRQAIAGVFFAGR